MLTDDFDFDLPAEAIAQRAAPRGTSRLLVLPPDGDRPLRHDQTVADLPRLLQPGDLLVVNDTRVIPARLNGRRLPGGGAVELLLAEPLDGPIDRARTWYALARPGKRCRPGTALVFGEDAHGDPGPHGVLRAGVVNRAADGRHRVRFAEPVLPWLERLGRVPLPPYIKRDDDADDRARYQTVYACAPGAIAAPTAGLHFDDALLARLEGAGIARASITLHVGLGTFKPVTAALVHEHAMDAEVYAIPPATAEAIAATRARGGRVVAVGTTVVRALETAAAQTHAANDDANGDGDGATDDRPVPAGAGESRLFITPGFRFRVVDVLLTNFHLPRSTLLMLVSALAGRARVLDAYREAVAHGYRFYSYGDAMLVHRTGDPAAR
ncbi:MAG: tRNA preQ1(34) S-adenosylmethionine ribosyltransferase-isomerase QueA [Acidobacteriota bacterium]